MLFSKLFLSLRYVLKDIEGTVFSDYQIEEAVNSVQNAIANALSVSNSELLTTTETIALTAGVGDLPSDFQSIVTVFNAGNKPLTYQTKSKPVDEWTYRIRDSKIYTTNSSVIIDYKKSLTPADLADLAVTMPLPDYFAEMIKRYVSMMLANGMSSPDAAMVQMISDDVYSLTSGREYSGIEITPSFSF
jgi:hypothetical protein